MKKIFLIIISLLSTFSFAQQELQKVEVIKSDKQVTELLEKIGDTELKIDVIDILAQPALNIGYEKIIDAYL